VSRYARVYLYERVIYGTKTSGTAHIRRRRRRRRRSVLDARASTLVGCRKAKRADDRQLELRGETAMVGYPVARRRVLFHHHRPESVQNSARPYRLAVRKYPDPPPLTRRFTTRVPFHFPVDPVRFVDTDGQQLRAPSLRARRRQTFQRLRIL